MESLITVAKQVMQIEAKEITRLAERLDKNFTLSCELIKLCSGKVILMGMGKSGHIANKIAATLASTGTSAFFVHPAEAGHGDLGMIDAQDIIIAISYSGENDEILMLMPIIKRLGVKLIAMTGSAKSSIALGSDVHLDVSVKREACPHNLTPTSSTTLSLVMGDALAISLLSNKGFSSKDFARTHPAGALGRRLLTLACDIMQKGARMPIISKNIPLTEVLLIMSEKTLGFVIIVDDNKKPLGVFTDGDLRRVFQNYHNIHKLQIFDVMTKNCCTIQADKPAVLALEMMQKHKINALAVVDENGFVVGAMNMHNLLNAKIL